MTEAAQTIETDPYEEACDQAIELSGGNLRAAIKSLLIVVDYLEHELDVTQRASSVGFKRKGSLVKAQARERQADG